MINRISKTQYLKGLQCPKALWFYRHRPDLFPQISEKKQYIFDSGNKVGRLAQNYFENGIEISEKHYEIDRAIHSTIKAVDADYEVIFEATACSDDGAYSRIDILCKVPNNNKWDLIEVKQSTRVKEYHYDDMAVQRYAFEGAGYNIKKSILMHINKDYIRIGNIDPNRLFVLEDCTNTVLNKLSDISRNLANMINMVNAKNEPIIPIGDHCDKPFKCDYKHHCWRFIPEYSVYNVFNGDQLRELLNQKIVEISDIPDNVKIKGKKAIDVSAFKNYKIHADKGRIKEFLTSLEYPLYFLDYETIFPAIPVYDNTSPYQQIPFQFSLHIQKNKGGSLIHKEFLHSSPTDPRPEFVKALIENCGSQGSIVVYSKPFESMINRKLSQAFPQFSSHLDLINDRMIDLLIPFRSRFLYHPEMKGSSSIKAVLPAFVSDLNYDTIEISDGNTAALSYLTYLEGSIKEPEKDKILRNLSDYCELDTLAEVRLVEILYHYAK